MHLGLPAINTANELGSFVKSATRFERPTDGSNWLFPGHIIGEVTAAIMSATRLETKYSYKTDFEIRTENQDFGRHNISMSRPPLESTPFGTTLPTEQRHQFTRFL